MKEDAPDHRKMKHLARLLKIPLPYANGIMERLWHHAGKYTPDGGIGRLQDEDIAEACAMPVDTDCKAFVEALAGAGFLDPLESCRYFIHDWPVHCTHYVHNRLANHQQYFADGSAPSLSRLQGEKRRERALEFYGNSVSAPTHHVSAPAHPVSAPAHPVSAPAHPVSAPAHPVSAPKTDAVSAHTPQKSAHGPTNARARPTPTPTPTPLEVLGTVENLRDPSSSRLSALMMNGEWKLTEAAVHSRFPSVNGNFWPRFLGKCGEEYRKHKEPKCGPFCDLLISTAVEQANNESPNQESAGLYLQTVPAILATWAKSGAVISTSQKTGFAEGVKKLARRKLERDGQL